MKTMNYEHVDYPVISGINPILTNIVHTDLHWHEDVEIVFAYQGGLMISLRGDHFILDQGNFPIINSEELHSVNSVQDNDSGIVFIMQISARFIKTIGINIEAFRFGQPSEHSRHFDEIRGYLLKIIEEINSRRQSFNTAVHGYCCNILAVLSRFNVVKEDEAAKKHRANDESNIFRLKHIFTYVKEHYNENPNIAQIAEREHISASHLSHLFTKAVGMSYSQYLNSVKIDMVRQALIETNDNITDIFLRHGFTNFKTFNRMFKKITGYSPTEYRKKVASTPGLYQIGKEKAGSHFGSYVNLKNDIVITNDLYRSRDTNDRSEPRLNAENKSVGININTLADTAGKKFKHYYKTVTAAARASDFLRADVREHFKMAQRDIGFRYVRFHGIFNDEMRVLNPAGDGTVFNFSYIDTVVDFLLSIELKPYVEFSFMPSALASGSKTIFSYRGNVSPPKDYLLWRRLIEAFMKHVISRYSAEEVRTWYFEVWNEASLPDYWDGSFDDYIALYRASAEAVKAADAKCRVGGPSLNSFQYNNAKVFLLNFLNRCAKENLPVDFVSGHPYPAFYFVVDNEWKETLCGPDQTKEDALWFRDTVLSSAFPEAELHLNEWNNSSIDWDITHDTAFMASFIIHNVVNCIGLADSLTYWALTDLFEENWTSFHEFNGGFGMINKNGLKKPSYFAFQYLSRLSNEIIETGENHIVTKKDGAVQILVWNYCHYNDEYANGNKSAASFYHRYEAFEINAPIDFNIRLSVPNGDYFIEKAVFDRDHGSVFDIWLKNGAVEYLKPGQLELIREQNHLSRSISIYQCHDGTVIINAAVEPFGFTFYEVKPF